MRLLIIADDITGALDTGVQFRNTNVVVKIYCENVFDGLTNDEKVVVIDSETRHMNIYEAYQRVYNIAKEGLKNNFDCIYKKTDSALRGNIGIELQAIKDAWNEKTVHFIPAHPEQKRTTKGGVHYVEGIEVSKSVFAEDEFTPVLNSYIPDVIKETSIVNSKIYENYIDDDFEGIKIYDSNTLEDLEELFYSLQIGQNSKLIAGCAGFASELRKLFKAEGKEIEKEAITKKLFIFCGSINPITVEQIIYAKNKGIEKVSLYYDQIIGDWLDTKDGQNILKNWINFINEHESLIVQSEKTSWDKLELSKETLRCLIRDGMAEIIKKMLYFNLEATLLVTGGDTLFGILDAIGVKKIIPILEIVPGLVLFSIVYQGKKLHIISKSGGFGDRDIILEVKRQLRNLEVYNETV